MLVGDPVNPIRTMPLGDWRAFLEGQPEALPRGLMVGGDHWIVPWPQPPWTRWAARVRGDHVTFRRTMYTHAYRGSPAPAGGLIPGQGVSSAGARARRGGGWRTPSDGRALWRNPTWLRWWEAYDQGAISTQRPEPSRIDADLLRRVALADADAISVVLDLADEAGGLHAHSGQAEIVVPTREQAPDEPVLLFTGGHHGSNPAPRNGLGTMHVARLDVERLLEGVATFGAHPRMAWSRRWGFDGRPGPWAAALAPQPPDMLQTTPQLDLT